MKGYKNLCHAILLSAIKDARHLKEHDDLREFLGSPLCEGLCLASNVDLTAYRKEVARRMERAVEKSSPKRLKTYKLAEVLHVGKNQGKCKDQEYPELFGDGEDDLE